MNDIYDDAIQATLKHDDIEESWRMGGETNEPMQLDALLFRSCPHMGCCLTEVKQGLVNTQVDEDCNTEVQQMLDDIMEDDLIPSDNGSLQMDWDVADEEQRLAILEQFAKYNRRLDYVFDREPQELIED